MAANTNSDEHVRMLERAVRYLWDAWSDAEGSGQPEAAVFGPDAELRRWLVEMGEPVREAPADVQAIIREVLGTLTPSKSDG